MHKLFVILLFVLTIPPLPAQSVQRLETLLHNPELSWAAAAAFVLEASEQGVFSNDAAFYFAMDRNWLPQNASPDESARLNGIALLLIQSFELKGGILFSRFQNPHYAYRELVYRNIIQGRTYQNTIVSGERLFFMVSRFLAIREAQEEAAELERRRADEEEQRLARERAAREALAREINLRLQAQQVADTDARVTDAGVTINLSNIQFLANAAELTDSERAKLREIARILETIPQRNILVAGHTALAGTRAAQQRTSLERARAVADYLISLGVRTAAEITVRGYGADQPLADNSTEAGMAQNRRVEITILQAGNR